MKKGHGMAFVMLFFDAIKNLRKGQKMKECSQTKDWTVSLFGDTLPKFVLYGKIYGRVYTCNPFIPRTKTGYYFVRIYSTAKKRWFNTTTETYPEIHTCIKEYICKYGIIGTHIEACQHRSIKSKEEFYRAKKSEAIHENNRQKDLRYCGLPVEKRPQASYLPTKDIYGQSAIDGKGYSIDYERNVWVDEKNPNALSCDERDKGYQQLFEMGQTTSGNIDGPYTRSGFEIKKDGMKITQNKLRPERMQKPDYMKTPASKRWKGENFMTTVRGKDGIPPKPVWQQVDEENKLKK